MAKGEGKAQLYLGKLHERGERRRVRLHQQGHSLGRDRGLDGLHDQGASPRTSTRTGKAIDILNAFEEPPDDRWLLEGAELVEYSAHNVPKGYKCMLEKPFADGYLVSGDALGAFVKIGPLLDGMRRAIATGIMAAEAYLKADEAGSFKSLVSCELQDPALLLSTGTSRGRDGTAGSARATSSTSVLPGLLFSASRPLSPRRRSNGEEERQRSRAMRSRRVQTRHESPQLRRG